MTNEFADEIIRNYNSKQKEIRKCRCCGKEWEVSGWNFYDLCSPCFANFDMQKMKTRFSKVFQGKDLGGTESATEYIKSKKCNHNFPKVL